MIEKGVLDGSLPEESRVPSTTELAKFHRINPATALKGINLLVEAGVIYKRRGVGMFVSTGAHEVLINKRKSVFRAQFVAPIVAEAHNLGISPTELTEMLKKEIKEL